MTLLLLMIIIDIIFQAGIIHSNLQLNKYTSIYEIKYQTNMKHTIEYDIGVNTTEHDGGGNVWLP